jgi:hypothetical protein
MKKKLPFLILFEIAASSVFAQIAMLSPVAISSSGGFYTIATGTFSTTVAEMSMVQTFHNGAWLTQGFQQPTSHLGVALNDLGNYSSEVIIFPNPAANQLSISIHSDNNVMYRLTVSDVVGRVITSFFYTPSAMDMIYNLDVNNLACGLYLLTVQSTDKKFTKTIRFVKN